MCMTCGCGPDDTHIDGEHLHHHHDHGHGAHVHGPGCGHDHSHDHGHDHAHHSHAPGMDAKGVVQIEQDILAKNNAYAQVNRAQFAAQGIFALNLVSSPGSGKTTLLCKTIQMLGDQPLAVIEGDQQTSQDAERIRATGAKAIQINTGKGCHLDAHMVGHALEKLEVQDDSLLLIENVGNLVCPAAFDLGEAGKVVILSVTEGEDKPLKYPTIFLNADLVIINKIDIADAVQFDRKTALENIRKVAPKAKVVELSARTGAGMEAWYAFLENNSAR